MKFFRAKCMCHSVFALWLLFLVAFGGIAVGQPEAGAWRILIQGDLTQADANSLRASRFADSPEVQVLPYLGSYGLFIGNYGSEQDATAEFANLESQGWVVAKVVNLGAAETVSSAPDAAAGAAAPAFNQATGNYRVLVDGYPTPGAAQAKKDDLEANLGLYPVDIVQSGGQYRVFAGYVWPTLAEAEDYARYMRELGPITARAVEIDATTAAGMAAVPKPTISGEDTASIRLSDTEMQRVREIYNQVQAGRSEVINREEYNRALTQLSELDSQARQYYEQLQNQQQEADRRRQEGRKLGQQVEEAVRVGNFEQASSLLSQWQQLDPENPAVGMVGELLRRRQAEANAAATAQAEVAGMIARAEQLESSEQWNDSLALWQQVKRQSTSNDDQLKANEAIRRISPRLGGSSVATGGSGGGSSLWLIIAVCAVALLLGGAAMYFYMRSRNKVQVVTATISKSYGPISSSANPLPGKPRPLGLLHDRPTGSRASKDGVATGAVRRDSKSAVQGLLPAEMPPQAAPGKSAGGKAPASPDPLSGSAISVDNLMDVGAASDLAPSSNGAEPPERTAPSAPDPIHSSAVRLENLNLATPPPEAGEVGSATAQREDSRGPAAAQPVPVDVHGAETVIAPAAVAAPVASAAAPAAAGATPYFSQNFEDEEIGATPKGWKGSYDYASLVVSPSDHPGSAKCMKFEKKSGTGSAYYACRFPDASGRIVVEFDLRCDHKNKYLLGFYIEMDEDFRHSIHTVVHMDATKADKVSLRLQNESAPYKLGEWCRVKYLIDLPRHMVDGFINDKPVVVGARLPSRPKVINTLSIRDNLATEGLLMIDNISIQRDRG